LDLEIKIRKLAIRPNSFVVGILDCCREIPDSTMKGTSEQIPEKISGQFCIVHAVGPSKRALSVRGSVDGLSEVTRDFLHVMNNSKLTFPSCIQSWAKSHPTVELIDKCQFEIKFSDNAVLPSSLVTSRPSNVDNWSEEDVSTWFSSLNLSHDYSVKLKSEHIDGSAFKSIIDGFLPWKDIGIETVGDIAKIKRALHEQKIV